MSIRLLPSPAVGAAATSMLLALTAAAQRDNMLLVLADDVGIEKIGAYGVGANPPPTSNIDALARSGVLFRNAWAEPVCSPTRAGIQTGRYPHRTGVGFPQLWLSGVLRPEETTLPELLDAAGAGYAHGYFGKWHLSDERNGGIRGPNVAGWSTFQGVLNGVARYGRWWRIVNGKQALSTRYHTSQTVDDALAWIRSVPEPWVCYVAFTAAHTPYHVPPPHLHTRQLGKNPSDLEMHKAMVESLDIELGRLLAGLGSQRSRTNVIFAADNGTPYGLAEPPFLPHRAKGSPYQGGVLVPMVVAGPAVTAPGREVQEIVGTVDLFATIAELCGADPEPRWVKSDSVSMVPYLQNPAQPPLRSTILTQRFEGTGAAPENEVWGIRDDRYKLIHIARQRVPEAFFDLAVDPWETNDLLAGTMTAAEVARYNALQAAAAELFAPAPRTMPYGQRSCRGSQGNPAIGASGAPRLGESYAVSLADAAPKALALLVVGASRTRFAAGSLPFDLQPIGSGPGCALYAAADVVLPTSTDAAGTASRSIAVPDDWLFVGGSLYHCWLSVDHAAPLNPLGLTASDGLAVGIAP